MNIGGSQADIYADFNGLAQLKAKAGGASAEKQEALEEVARQFETIFLKMMLKSMRDTVPDSELIDNEKTKFYESMYDDQISLDLSKRGNLGLADMIVQQLGGNAPASTVANGQGLSNYRDFAVQRIHGALQVDTVQKTDVSKTVSSIKSPEEFINKMWPQAQQAAKELGVDAKVLLAQSALETGWGKHIMQTKEGESSHNLFGIKASHGWEGKTVSVQTVEYENGIASKRQATFRAYDSYEDSFNDYVQFLKQNPRYQQALAATDSNEGFVKGLQKAGYATDPAYANKILSILGREQLSALTPVKATATTDLAA
ncbi:MAG: flagellar assembly peptidoglycan hydrolase FlgJ [Cycloclasticus sp.]|nr:flagellar assembly peptidoglycan hydrolase FlgJ [Cycloclasticus sp.]